MNLYFTQNGKGKFTFLFIHGNSSSSQSFRYQLESELADEFILHAIDLPGHGKSPKAESLDIYSLPGYAATINGHIKEHNLTNVILVGWSLGGHIALEMLGNSDQFKGVILFGTPPLGIPPEMEAAFLPNEAVNIGFTPEVDQAAALTYASSFFKRGSDVVLAPYAEDILLTDGAARGNLVPSMSTVGYKDEVQIVSGSTTPIMIIHGEQEQLVNSEYLAKLAIPALWENKIQYIKDAGHAPQIETPHMFNSLLTSFAGSLS